jgi:multidrug efflux pump subunit AcrB
LRRRFSRLGADRPPVRRSPGCDARLDNLVDFELVEEAGRIDRLDRQRMVAVRANVAPGFALGDRLA